MKMGKYQLKEIEIKTIRDLLNTLFNSEKKNIYKIIKLNHYYLQ